MLCAFAVACTSAWAQARKDLEIYFIDVEGGQATLFVTPAGQSLLIDAGWRGARDADRISDIARQAGLTQIDYLVVTHFHGDHVGGIPDLASRIPIKTFIDHGATVETTPGAVANYAAYVSVRDKAQHLLAKPGDRLPIKGLTVQVVAAAARTITSSIFGGGRQNPSCAEFHPKDEVADPLVGGENKQSVALAISLGRFRMVDFGDLTWNVEHTLACPRSLIGPIDLYIVSHHGQDISNLPMLVKGLRPRVAIMNNGAKKGGAAATFGTLRATPELQDLWQLHHAVDAGDLNTPEEFIANTGVGGSLASGVPDEGIAFTIKVTARPDGSFSVTNTRNAITRQYAPRK